MRQALAEADKLQVYLELFNGSGVAARLHRLTGFAVILCGPPIACSLRLDARRCCRCGRRMDRIRQCAGRVVGSTVFNLELCHPRPFRGWLVRQPHLRACVLQAGPHCTASAATATGQRHTSQLHMFCARLHPAWRAGELGEPTLEPEVAGARTECTVSTRAVMDVRQLGSALRKWTRLQS